MSLHPFISAMLVQLAGLPAVTKFLLARPVERGPRRYRAWGVGLCLAGMLVIMLGSRPAAA